MSVCSDWLSKKVIRFFSRQPLQKNQYYIRRPDEFEICTQSRYRPVSVQRLLMQMWNQLYSLTPHTFLSFFTSKHKWEEITWVTSTFIYSYINPSQRFRAFDSSSAAFLKLRQHVRWHWSRERSGRGAWLGRTKKPRSPFWLASNKENGMLLLETQWSGQHHNHHDIKKNLMWLRE